MVIDLAHPLEISLYSFIRAVRSPDCIGLVMLAGASVRADGKRPKEGGLIPIPEPSIAPIEAESRPDGPSSFPVATTAAADATVFPHVPAGARRVDPAAVGHSGELWTGEVDRLFTAALQELRRGTEQAMAAVEQRRIAELTELSRAIKKQHDIIETLKREIGDVRQAAAIGLSEAQRRWQQSEGERLKAAQAAWETEKSELKRVADRYRSVSEQLADQLASLKADSESKERQYFDRLREITAEVDKCLLRARAEWVTEVARLADNADWQIPAFLNLPPNGT